MAIKLKWNTRNHTYQMVDYKSIDDVKEKLNEMAHIDLVIENDLDYKAQKEARTCINNFVKEVADTRKQMTALVISQFSPMMVAIEKHGAELSTKITAKLNAYKPPKEREKTYKIVIKSKDLKAIQKIKDVALKYECEIDEERN